MTVKDGATDVSDQKLISSDKDCYIYIVASLPLFENESCFTTIHTYMEKVLNLQDNERTRDLWQWPFKFHVVFVIGCYVRGKISTRKRPMREAYLHRATSSLNSCAWNGRKFFLEELGSRIEIKYVLKPNLPFSVLSSYSCIVKLVINISLAFLLQ